MKTTNSTAVLLALMILAGLTTQGAAARQAYRTEWGHPDFSGTYVWQRTGNNCNIPVTDGTVQVIHITHSSEFLTLRSNITRVLDIRQNAHITPRALSYARNGIARWEGKALVVESRMPATPLGSEYLPQPPGIVLVEQFSFADPVHLTYDAGYRRPGEPPYVELKTTLVKCPAAPRPIGLTSAD
jgi:hypothetical protein